MLLSNPQSTSFTTNVLSTLSFLSTIALENIFSFFKHDKIVAPENAIFRVRLFEPSDNEAVQHLFHTAFATQEGSLLRTTIHAELTGGMTSLFYIIGFLGFTLFMPNDAYHPVQGTIMIMICLVLIFRSLHKIFMAYRFFINQGLTGDLLDVGKYYSCNNAYWVAEMITKEGQATVVGGIGIEANVDPITGSVKSAGLRRMMVSPICRRRGVASRLIEVSLEHGKKHGIQSIVLSTSSFQESAIQLYQKYGFVMKEKWAFKQGIWVATMELDLSYSISKN